MSTMAWAMKIFRNRYFQYALVFMLGFLQFSNTLNHDYAWDDTIVILENPDVRSGFAGLEEIWHKQHSDYIHDQIGYRPLVLSTFAIEQEFFPMNPKIGHLMNVAYFAMLCMVILFFLHEIFPPAWRLKALLSTLLFIVHPLHCEVVANIKSRDEIFQLLFSLLSIIFYFRWSTQTKWWQLLLAVVFFTGAMLSRENAIVTVALIPITVMFFGNGLYKNRLIKLIPIAGLVLIGVLILMVSLSSGSGITETAGMGIVYEHNNLANAFSYLDFGEVKRIINFNLVLLRYLKNFFWPLDLVYYYGYNQLKLYDVGDLVPIMGAIATFFLILVTVVTSKLRPIFAYGAMFFFVAIFPFLQFANSMPDTMADRFAFGPSIGLCIAVVSLGGWMLERLFRNSERLQKTIAWALIISVLGFYSFQTFERNKAWKDNFTLFSTDIGKLDNCAKAHEHYADALHQKYLKTGDASLIPDITYHYQSSIEISDKSYYSFLKLGSNYASFGNPEMGIQLLRKAVDLFPGKADPNFYLGSALYNQEKYELALPYLDSSIRFSPRMPDSYFLKILSLEALGRLDNALIQAETAVAFFPKDIRIRDAACDMYMGKEMYDVAFAHADTLLDLVGIDPVHWKKAIGIRQIAGYDSEAAKLYQKGLKLNVNFDN
jgi:tetratricopeptide (TPR) repeat protein